MSKLTPAMKFALETVTIENGSGHLYFHHSVTISTQRALARRGLIKQVGGFSTTIYKRASYGYKRYTNSDPIFIMA